MSVVSNPLIYNAILASINSSDQPPPTIAQKSLNPEPTIKNGSFTNPVNNQTITYSQYRYIISYGEVSMYLYIFTNVNYTGNATSTSPQTLIIPLNEFPIATTDSQTANVLYQGVNFAMFMNYGVGNPPDTELGYVTSLEVQGPGFSTNPSDTIGSEYAIAITVSANLTNMSFGMLLFYVMIMNNAPELPVE